MTACGKKRPAAAAARQAAGGAGRFHGRAPRRGSSTLQFTVPATNTDGSRPANVERIDVYAFTGAGRRVNDDELVKLGTKVASVPVKAPRDPDAATGDATSRRRSRIVEPDGLDQGAVAQLEDPLTPAALSARSCCRWKNTARTRSDPGRPAGRSRSSVRRADRRRQDLRPRSAEQARPQRIVLATDARADGSQARAAGGADDRLRRSGDRRLLAAAAGCGADSAAGDRRSLPGRYIGMETSSYAYHVYDVSPPAASDTEPTTTPQLAKEVRLTREAGRPIRSTATAG